MEARPGVGGPSAARGVDRPSARLLRFRAGRARHRGGGAEALPGLSGGSFSPEAPAELEMSTTSSEAYIDGRVERDLIVLAGGALPSLRARNIPLGVASVPREPRRRDAHETGPAGAERGGSPPRWDARPLAAPAGEARVALGPSHGARRINGLNNFPHPG